MNLTIYIVDEKDGARRERRPEDIPEKERRLLAEELTDRMMKSAGFVPAEAAE